MEEFPVYSVSELTHQLQTYLESEYGEIRVEGEISGFKVSHSGHAYFSLKDEGATLSCVIWRSALARLRIDLADGQQVRATGGLTIYPPRGNYQMIVRRIEPAGEGLLMKRFEEMKKRLEAEGLFDPARKRPIPALPKRLAVITSPTGAAIRDFLKGIGRRGPDLQIDIFPVHVQGLEAPGEIAHALEVLGRLGRHDLLVVTRGGGSLEDLWAFNDERVARAMAACPIAVISAVGHEIDFTIADFVSDLRLPTPTAAAQYIVEKREDRLRKLDAAVQSLIQYGRRRLETLAFQHDALQSSLLRLSPRSRVGTERQRLDEQLGRMELLAARRLERMQVQTEKARESLLRLGPESLRRGKERLEALGGRLRTLSPTATLQRGYSLTAEVKTGRILKDSRRVEPGQRIRTRLSRGELVSEIHEVNHERTEER